MTTEGSEPRSRRAILAAAAGAAGAFAAHAALPLSASAVSTNLMTETDNATVATTSVVQSTDGQTAFRARNTTTGAAALIGSSGDETMSSSSNTSSTGVYGWAPTTASTASFATGLWGDSEDVGTYGSGYVGVRGDGFFGVIGVGDPGGAGVKAYGGTATDVALAVVGKVTFSRSGRVTIGAGKSTAKVTLAGVSAGSRVFAVLHSNRSGRYVRAVVPTSGYFTIYLNTTVASSTYVAWFVIN